MSSYDKKKVYNKIVDLINKDNIDPQDIDIEIDYPSGAVGKWLKDQKDMELLNKLGDYLKNKYGVDYEDLSNMDKSSKKMPFNIIMIFIIIAVLAGLFVFIINFNKIKDYFSLQNDKKEVVLEITDPVNGTDIDLDKVNILSNDEVSVRIKIKCRNADLIPKGSYLNCFACVLSGAEYYVTGKSTNLISEDQVMDFITLGNLNDNNDTYEIILLIGDKKYNTGDTLENLPDYLYRSNRVIVNIDKKSLREKNKN